MTYAKSTNVVMYPSAYRGKDSNLKVFDPEARMFTEENIGRVYKNIASYKSGNYLISGTFLISDGLSTISDFTDDKIIEFVISGYYFKVTWDSSLNPASGSPLFAYIKIEGNNTQDADNTNFKNRKLVDLEGQQTDLDVLPSGSSEYVFRGLGFTDTDPGANYNRLLLLDSDGKVPEASKLRFDYKNIFGGLKSSGAKGLNNYFDAKEIHLDNVSGQINNSTNPNNNEYATLLLKANDASLRAKKIYNDYYKDSANTVIRDGQLNIEAPNKLSIKRNSNNFFELGSRTISGSIEDYLNLFSEDRLTLSSSLVDIRGNTIDCYAVSNTEGTINFSTAKNSSRLYLRMPYSGDSGDYAEPNSSSSSPSIIATRNWLNNTSKTVTLSGDKVFLGNVDVGNSSNVKNVNLYSNSIVVNPSGSDYDLKYDGNALSSNKDIFVIDSTIAVKNAAHNDRIKLTAAECLINTQTNIKNNLNVWNGTKASFRIDNNNAKITLGAINNLIDTDIYCNSSFSIKDYSSNTEHNLFGITKNSNNYNIKLSDSSKYLVSFFDGYLKEFKLKKANNNIKFEVLDDAFNVNLPTNITGNLEATGTTKSGGKLTVTSSGADISGDSIIRGNLNVVNKFTVHTDAAVISSWGTANFKGSVTAAYFDSQSDRRLKENIKEFTSKKSILELPVVEYDFIDNKRHTIGCIAQDLKEICPEIVHENENGYLSIEESKLVYLLLDEVKKLKSRIDELESK